MKAAIIAIIIFLLWCAGFFVFMSYAKNASNENINTSSAIITFGGSQKRILVGVQLLKLGYAPIMYITGNKPEEEYTNFIKSQGLIPEQFLFDTQIANSHLSPINDTLAFMHKYQFQSARVVVKWTQLPRARLQFSNAIFGQLNIIPHSTPYKKEKITKIFIEYAKYTLTLIASFIGMDNELNLSYS